MKKNILLKMGILLIVALLVSAGMRPGSAVSHTAYPKESSGALAAAPDNGYTISGRVTDNADKPLAGVTLRALVATYPIVFVHGLRSFPPQRSGCTPDDRTRLTDDAIGNHYFGVVDDRLALSYPVFYAHLVSNPCYTAPLVVNVQHLKDSIDTAKAATQASKVILIAHDMGGLISRAYIEESIYQGDVDALFTFGSPHLGTSDDVLTFLANLS